jgi:hypothetical protein
MKTPAQIIASQSPIYSIDFTALANQSPWPGWTDISANGVSHVSSGLGTIASADPGTDNNRATYGPAASMAAAPLMVFAYQTTTGIVHHQFVGAAGSNTTIEVALQRTGTNTYLPEVNGIGGDVTITDGVPIYIVVGYQRNGAPNGESNFIFQGYYDSGLTNLAFDAQPVTSVSYAPLGGYNAGPVFFTTNVSQMGTNNTTGVTGLTSIKVYDMGSIVSTIEPRAVRSPLMVSAVPVVTLIQSSSDSNDKQTSRCFFLATGLGVLNPRLEFQNFDGFDNAGPNNITVTAGIEYPVGSTNIYPVTFGGSLSVTLPPGAKIIADPVGISVFPGDSLAVRTCIVVPSGGTFLTNYTTGYLHANSSPDGVLTNVDYSLSGTIPSSNTFAYGPTNIFGDVGSDGISILHLGDSISWGTGGDHSRGSFIGIAQTMIPNVGIVNASVPGFTLGGAALQINIARHALSESPYANFATFLLGINDLNALPIMQDYAFRFAAMCAARGLPCYPCTLLPSTDAGNLADATTGPQINAFNAWLRTSPAPFAGYIDTAGAVTVLDGNGLPTWTSTNGTVDTVAGDGSGPHPNLAGHQKVAAVYAAKVATLAVAGGSALSGSTGVFLKAS